MLSAEETRSTTSVRLGLAKQLAETLIHSIRFSLEKLYFGQWIPQNCFKKDDILAISCAFDVVI